MMKYVLHDEDDDSDEETKDEFSDSTNPFEKETFKTPQHKKQNFMQINEGRLTQTAQYSSDSFIPPSISIFKETAASNSKLSIQKGITQQERYDLEGTSGLNVSQHISHDKESQQKRNQFEGFSQNILSTTNPLAASYKKDITHAGILSYQPSFEELMQKKVRRTEVQTSQILEEDRNDEGDIAAVNKYNLKIFQSKSKQQQYSTSHALAKSSPNLYHNQFMSNKIKSKGVNGGQLNDLTRSFHNLDGQVFEEIETKEILYHNDNHYLHSTKEVLILPKEEENVFQIVNSNQQLDIVPSQTNQFEPQIVPSPDSEDEQPKKPHIVEIRNESIVVEGNPDSLGAIEEKVTITRVKLIDFTIKQKLLSDSVKLLDQERESLKIKLGELGKQRLKALAISDVEEVGMMNARIDQTKTLISQNEGQISRYYDDYRTLETKKVAKFKELSQLIHKALYQIEELKQTQMEEKEQFSEQEQNAIKIKKKRLHYESLRIDEGSKQLLKEKDKVYEKLGAIEGKVYGITKEQLVEKKEVEEKIIKIENEIDDIENLLANKKRERENFIIKKQSYEVENYKAKSIFRNQLLVLEHQLKKIQRNEDQNNKDLQKLRMSQNDLIEYEDSYRECIEGFKKELKEMNSLSKNLKKNAYLIDSTVEDKELYKEKAYCAKIEIGQMMTKNDSLTSFKETALKKIEVCENKSKQLLTEIDLYNIKIKQLSEEKKKSAEEKKFKEAQKCVNQIKEASLQAEEARLKWEYLKDDKQRAQKDLSMIEEEIQALSEDIKDCQEQFERVYQRILIYRKADILEFIRNLDEISNKGKLKQEAYELKKQQLQEELDKIDSELFDLDKKFGKFFVKSEIVIDMSSSESEDEDNQQLVELPAFSPDNKYGSSHELIDHLTQNQELSSIGILKVNIKENMFQTREQMELQVDCLIKSVIHLESQLEEAIEIEDFDKADNIQTKINNITNEQIPSLRQKLESLIVEEDKQKQDQIGDEKVEVEKTDVPSLFDIE